MSGRAYELLTGVFGARSRVVTTAARCRSDRADRVPRTEGPADPRRYARQRSLLPAHRDRRQRHAKAYRRLRRARVEHASTGPQRLPDWNPNAGGISAFYFRDPDRHFLEIICSSRRQRRSRSGMRPTRLFLGIDHTAIVVDDTNASLRFYRDTLGMQVAGESENYDVEQEHLNNVFGARLRITALRAAPDRASSCSSISRLATDGRRPADLRANDIAHWQTTLVAERLEPLLPLARDHRITSGVAWLGGHQVPRFGFRSGALTRDPDGHGMRIVGGAQ